jgi:hypothetical protein
MAARRSRIARPAVSYLGHRETPPGSLRGLFEGLPSHIIRAGDARERVVAFEVALALAGDEGQDLEVPVGHGRGAAPCAATSDAAPVREGRFRPDAHPRRACGGARRSSGSGSAGTTRASTDDARLPAAPDPIDRSGRNKLMASAEVR